MERMSESELKQLRDLQAKQKRVQRAETEFFKEADLRKDELLERWDVSDRLADAAKMIDTDPSTLYEWITSEEQIAYFKKRHGMYSTGYGYSMSEEEN